MKRRERILVLCAAVVAATAVAGVLVVKWPALIAEYHVFQLERARNYEDARSWLAAMEDDAARGASDALFARLRGGTSYAAYWLFAVAGDAGLKDALASAFEERLRANDETMRLWSYFVRWRGGVRLLDRLDSMSPSPDASEAQLLCRLRFPSDSPGFTPDGKPTHPDAMNGLAVLWFL